MSAHDFAADMPPSSPWLHRRDMEPVAPHSADHFAPSQSANAYPVFGIEKSMNTATGLRYRPSAPTTYNYYLSEQRSAVLPSFGPPLTNPDRRIGSHAANDSSNSSIFKVCKSTSRDSTAWQPMVVCRQRLDRLETNNYKRSCGSGHLPFNGNDFHGSIFCSSENNYPVNTIIH